MSNAPIVSFQPGNVVTVGSENTKAQLQFVMTPICIHCRNKIVSQDGMFYYVGYPYYGLIHKECAPYYAYVGMWPHSQNYQFYVMRSKGAVPGESPSPGTVL